MKVRMETSIGGNIEAAYGETVDVDAGTGKRLIASGQATAVGKPGKAKRESATTGPTDAAVAPPATKKTASKKASAKKAGGKKAAPKKASKN